MEMKNKTEKKGSVADVPLEGTKNLSAVKRSTPPELEPEQMFTIVRCVPVGQERQHRRHRAEFRTGHSICGVSSRFFGTGGQ
jgi:hypothetical protein